MNFLWSMEKTTRAGIPPKRLAEEGKGLLLRLETELEQLDVLPMPETAV